MRLKQPLLKLPRRYCAETLEREVRALPPSAWVAHPGRFVGNDAVLLVTPNGERTNAFEGPMAPTENLHQCPYIMEIMADLGAVWGRSRLMGLAPGAEVPQHVDVHYHWRTHTRIHVPVITNPDVIFSVGDEQVHMKPGECWTFDSFRPHNVQNGGSEKRIHLVLDTVGGDELWDLVKQAEDAKGGPEPEIMKPGQRRTDNLRYERFNAPGVMTPWEIRCHSDFIRGHLPPDPMLDPVFERLDKFAYAWSGVWAEFGNRPEGLGSFRTLTAELERDLQAMPGSALRLTNTVSLMQSVNELILKVALPKGSEPAAAAGRVGTAPRAGTGSAIRFG